MGRLHEFLTDLDHYKAIITEDVLHRYEFTGKYGPIIGIHGIGGGWHKEVRDYMTSNDIGGVLTYFGLLIEGVDTYLPQLHEEIKKYPNPLILGFSGGGFVALRYGEKYGWDKLQKIITVATPFGGTTEIPKIMDKVYKEISPGSIFLEKIANIAPPPNKVVSLFSTEDRHTPNPSNLKLNWPTTILDGNSHGSLQSSWKKISYVINAELGI